MKIALRSLALTVGTTLVVGSAQAQSSKDSSENCYKALVLDRGKQITSRQAYYEFLKLINRSNYKEVKRRVDSGMKFPIEGIPWEGNLNYEDFDAARSKLFSKINYKRSAKASSWLRWQRLSDNATKAYINCLKLNSRTKPGLHMWVVETTPSVVVINIRWKIPQGDGRGVRPKYSLSGGAPSGELPATIRPDGHARVQIRRSTTEFLVLSVSARGYADTIVLRPRRRVDRECDDAQARSFQPPACVHVRNPPDTSDGLARYNRANAECRKTGNIWSHYVKNNCNFAVRIYSAIHSRGVYKKRLIVLKPGQDFFAYGCNSNTMNRLWSMPARCRLSFPKFP